MGCKNCWALYLGKDLVFNDKFFCLVGSIEENPEEFKFSVHNTLTVSYPDILLNILCGRNVIQGYLNNGMYVESLSTNSCPWKFDVLKTNISFYAKFKNNKFPKGNNQRNKEVSFYRNCGAASAGEVKHKTLQKVTIMTE